VQQHTQNKMGNVNEIVGAICSGGGGGTKRRWDIGVQMAGVLPKSACAIAAGGTCEAAASTNKAQRQWDRQTGDELGAQAVRKQCVGQKEGGEWALPPSICQARGRLALPLR
jgi:hypothetical protein